MSKFFGIHQVELKSGVTEAEFEKFLKTVKNGPTITNRVLKGVRGERKGKYIILAEAKSMEDRDQWFTDEDELNEAGKQWFEDHPDVAQWFETLDELSSGFGVTFTDYVEI